MSSLLRLGPTNLLKTTVRDVAVEVAIAPLARGSSSTVQQKPERKTASHNTIQATCIISSWSIEDTQYFTLTFTKATTMEPSHDLRPTTRIVNRIRSGIHPESHRPDSSPSLDCRSGDSSDSMSNAVTPTLQQAEILLSGSPIESRNDIATPASILRKAAQLKDAILNSIGMPAYGSSWFSLFKFDGFIANTQCSYVERRKIRNP